MRPHRLPAPRVLALFRQICEGLAAAHDNGVIHRDLKPLNVLVDKNDNVFVADFGLALSFEDVSATASIVGSPSYMSPEQVMGEPVDARTDIFSLGVVLYELLTGSTPYGGGSAHEIMQKRVHSQPRPWRELNPDVPSYLDGVLARCLARAPADRYPSVHALLADLDARRASPPVSATAPRREGRKPKADPMAKRTPGIPGPSACHEPFGT
jgi:serine/threonine-protein kinase